MLFFRLATVQDIDEVFEVVNAAYTVELGNSGVSFKTSDRYGSSNSVIADLPSIWVLREKGNVERGIMIGCTKAAVNTHTQIVEIGPVAIRREYQVLMVLSKLSNSSRIIQSNTN